MKRDGDINRRRIFFTIIATITVTGFCTSLFYSFTNRQRDVQESNPGLTPNRAPKFPLTEPPIETSPPGPPDIFPGRSLEKRRGNQAQKWWNAWKVAYPAELKKNLANLSAKIQLSPGQQSNLAPLFQKEEQYWMEYLDRELEPVFQKGEKPDFRALMNQSYHALIDRICSDTDMQIRALLSKKQWDLFHVWRKKYNRDRYYWSEGRDRD